MALMAAEATVQRLTFGHPTAAAARAALGDDRPAIKIKTPTKGTRSLIRRLQAYASGAEDDFRDVPIDPGPSTAFRRRVWNACRRIPYGATISYAELANRAGCPGAARAVGNCMAANPIPLIVPCHRVLRADGRLGAYSAPGGAAMKRRLLILESRDYYELV